MPAFALPKSWRSIASIWWIAGMASPTFPWFSSRLAPCHNRSRSLRSFVRSAPETVAGLFAAGGSAAAAGPANVAKNQRATKPPCHRTARTAG